MAREPGARRPTMVDVARHAGVSLKTVSRVINNAPHVNPTLAARVLASAAELGFQRNLLASTLRSGQPTATIGLLVPSLADPFAATVAEVGAGIAGEHGSLLIAASTGGDPDREHGLLRDLCARRVDGLLVVPTGTDHGFLRTEVEMGIPAVFLGRPPGGLLADTVLPDNRGGAEAAIAALVAGGHRRIGILVDSLHSYVTRERLGGALDALARAGVEYDETLVRDGVGTGVAATVATMLDRSDPPTAFVGLDHQITIAALAELWRRGSPAGLVGFDDFAQSPLMPRPLTVVAYDVADLATRAVGLLFDRVHGGRGWPRTVVVPTGLVERGVGPA